MQPGGQKAGAQGQAQANNQRTCKIITSYLPYEGWLTIAKEMVHFGQFAKARTLLEEAKNHATYLALSE